jgi:AcrR family transcriptional regulator
VAHRGSHRGRSNADAALLAALASGATVRDAAKSAGVAERTVYRRLDDPEFRRRVDSTRAEMVSQAVARLSAAATEAVDTLRDLLSSDMDFARLGAARAILEIGIRLREHGELAERIATLEAQLSEAPATPKTGAGGRPWVA